MKLVLLTFIFSFTFLYSNEMSERNHIINQVKTLFLQSKFKELTAISENYLSTNSRTKSGKWKLDLFYTGIGYSLKYKDFDTLKKISLKWIQEYPNSTTAHISHGILLAEKGWQSRGRNLAVYTLEEQLNSFKNYLQEARIYLNKHKKVISENPGWYRLMINIAKGENWNKKNFYTLFDEAILKHPHYNPIYYGALYRMDPKWGSFTKEEIEKIAQKALLATKEKEGNAKYARFYWVASQLIYKENLFTKSNVQWNIMKEGINDVLKEFPSQWNINYFAYYSCLAGDKNKTKELLSKLTSKIEKHPWGYGNTSYKKCLSWANHQDSNPIDFKKVTEIPLNKLDDYININTDKPTLIHFSSYAKNSTLSDITMLNTIAEKLHTKMNFTSINMIRSSPKERKDLYLKYYMEREPFSMIVHNKKIVERLEHKLFFTNIPYDRTNVVTATLKRYLKEVKTNDYFQQFQKTIKDKSSLLNSEENIRDAMSTYHNANKYKATAAAIDFFSGKWAFGRILSETTQNQANEKALSECEHDRKKFNIKSKCQLHMVDNIYVFEKTEDEVQKVIENQLKSK